MEIQGNWKMRDFAVGEARDLEVASPAYIDYFWMPAEVPGDVHSTLLRKGIIEDPFYGFNDQKCRWVEEKVWWYRTVFEIDEEFAPDEKAELCFDGLDTFATVYLNGIELGSTENMFIRHIFEVTRDLKVGKNVLAVKFDPVDDHVSQKVRNYWAGFSKSRIWTRKSQSQFGWDWGPRLVCTGIWRPVRLIKSRFARLEHVFAKTLRIEDNQAEMEVDVDIHRFDRSKSYRVKAILRTGDQSVEACGFATDGFVRLGFAVDSPELWWTHDLGSPTLYDLHVELYADDECIDRSSQKIGIRTLEVKRVDEAGNPCFTFVLNGHNLFAKGANWIPIDSFVASVPDSRYRHLIRMAKDANMNMLRAWGGGIYEQDVFYDECDRLGLLVWQDFMFSCALYPDYNKNFMANVREEVAQVVKTLRSRTCLALWCGNNENDWLYEALHASGEIEDPFYGEKIYHELMPELLEELDPTRLFWPSSPYGGNDHNSREEGDTHNWQVWHGNEEPRVFGQPQTQDYSVEGVSFKNFRSDHTKFASEFGMHASSNRYTLASYIPSDRFYWGSEEFSYRNKDIHHPKGILLMEGYTGAPTNLEEYIDYSMLTQAEGLRFGIEHYRRNKEQTSGALFWQLNDCWPGTSWSVIDYFGLPKASYHYARKFFQPVMLSLVYAEERDELEIWLVNDRLQPYEDEIEFAVCDFRGQVLFSKSMAVSAAGNSTSILARFACEEALHGRNPDQVVCVLRSRQGRIEDSYNYLRDYKDIAYPDVHLTIEVDERNQEITMVSDALARMIKIEIDCRQIVISDNFFDLLPGEVKKVKVTHPFGSPVPWETLSIRAINSI